MYDIQKMHDIGDKILMELKKILPDLSENSLIVLPIALNIIIIFLITCFLIIFFLSKNRFIKIFSTVLTAVLVLFILFQIVLYIDMAFIEPNWIKVEYVNLKIPNLGKVLKNFKVVQFSDLHVYKFGFREKQLIRIVNSLKPDIILFTGGFTGDDFENIDSALSGAIKVFNSLKAKKGIWAVTDDTDDSLLNNHTFRKRILDTGINILFNQSEKIYVQDNKYFWLIGIEDSFYGGNGLLDVPFDPLAPEPKILISHSPGIIDNLTDYNIDLVIVGKTHGGQIGIKALRDMSHYLNKFKYFAGLYNVNGTYLYVNRGIGVKTSPYRLLCRPEVTVFNITDEI